jgi:hypothetical protein
MSNFFLTNIGDEDEDDNTMPSEHMNVHEHDLSSGGEFLDDGLRMHEQPLHLTKKNP